MYKNVQQNMSTDTFVAWKHTNTMCVNTCSTTQHAAQN